MKPGRPQQLLTQVTRDIWIEKINVYEKKVPILLALFLKKTTQTG